MVSVIDQLDRLPLSEDARQRLQNVLQHFDKLEKARAVGAPSEAPHTGLQSLGWFHSESGVRNLAALASVMLTLQGKPYRLSPNYLPMLPMFNLFVPRQQVVKSGRQISKSTSLAASLCLRGAVRPYLNILTVAPRYEQIRRLSNNYVRPFIEFSPVRGLLRDVRSERSVLQRTLANQSNLFFTFAFLDCDRVRGISSNFLNIDEAQDIDYDHLPVISETMSASPWGHIAMYFGTPKTYDNTLQTLWDDSSQAEWIMRCACGYDNVPTVAGGVMDMIRPGGLFCKKCDRHLQPDRQGQWVHTYGERRHLFAGWHIPQVIMRMHWNSDDKWSEILHKRQKYPPPKFLNEVLGESCDVGAQMLMLPELKAACSLPWPNKIDEALKHVKSYQQIIMGIDWGGRGAEEVSFTVVVIIGVLPGGRLEMIYAERLFMLTDELQEAARVRQLYSLFKPRFVAHDFNGSGALREIMINQGDRGIPLEAILPISWVAASRGNIMHFVPPGDRNQRGYHTADKTRVLSLCVACVKTGKLLMPLYESGGGLFDDWLALYTEKVEVSRGADILLVKRKAKKSDDLAHACGFAAAALWQISGEWPQFDQLVESQITRMDEDSDSPAQWDAVDVTTERASISQEAEAGQTQWWKLKSVK